MTKFFTAAAFAILAIVSPLATARVGVDRKLQDVCTFVSQNTDQVSAVMSAQFVGETRTAMGYTLELASIDSVDMSGCHATVTGTITATPDIYGYSSAQATIEGDLDSTAASDGGPVCINNAEVTDVSFGAETWAENVVKAAVNEYIDNTICADISGFTRT